MDEISDQKAIHCSVSIPRITKAKAQKQIFNYARADVEKMSHMLQSLADELETAIFIDLSKAFDRVPHKLLMIKIRNLNLDNSTTNWIENFLTNRWQSVKLNDYISSTVAVSSGVPQGCVLGPLLFLIYVNDIVSNISSPIRLFTDDCVIYREIRYYTPA